MIVNNESIYNLLVFSHILNCICTALWWKFLMVCISLYNLQPLIFMLWSTVLHLCTTICFQQVSEHGSQTVTIFSTSKTLSLSYIFTHSYVSFIRTFHGHPYCLLNQCPSVNNRCSESVLISYTGYCNSN